ARSCARPYPGNVVSSYQMNSSCRFNDHADCPLILANHRTLSLELLSHLPPTDHCAIPRPGPPPYCTAFGFTPDSWSRLPTIPAAWKFVRPLLTKKLYAGWSLAKAVRSASVLSPSPSGRSPPHPIDVMATAGTSVPRMRKSFMLRRQEQAERQLRRNVILDG